MLGFLFPRLTASPSEGAALFAAVTAAARQPYWYVEAKVPDTIDGRFRMLATIAALVTVRLERAGAEGSSASVTFTERFIEVMESEHREIGLGDPTLGKTVRKLVGSLAKRVELWRAAVNGEADWAAAVRASLYRDQGSSDGERHAAARLERIWEKLAAAPDDAVISGTAL